MGSRAMNLRESRAWRINMEKHRHRKLLLRVEWDWLAHLSLHPSIRNVSAAEAEFTTWCKMIKKEGRVKFGAYGVFVLLEDHNPHLHVLMRSEKLSRGRSLMELDTAWAERFWPYDAQISTKSDRTQEVMVDYLLDKKNTVFDGRSSNTSHFVYYRPNLTGPIGEREISAGAGENGQGGTVMTGPFTRPVPHRLKKVFKKHGISQWTIARELGISQALVCLYLNREKPMPPAVERRLVELEGLLDRTEKAA